MDQTGWKGLTKNSKKAQKHNTKDVASKVTRPSASPWLKIARKEFETAPPELFNASSSASAVIKFNSPAANRLQLRTRACDIWFPEQDSIGLDRAMGFVASSMAYCPALAVALDAAHLVHLGGNDGDQRMLLAGHKMYGQALGLLRKELQTGAEKQTDTLIGTISILQIIEAFSHLSLTERGWDRHRSGITGLLGRLPNDTGTSGFADLLTFNFRTFYIWDALIARRGISCIFQGDSKALVSIAQRLTEALEGCETACRTKDPELASIVMDSLAEIEEDFKVWTTSWNRSIRDASYTLVPSTKYPFPEVRKTKPSKAFPLVFQFKDLSDVLDHTLCSACLLSLKRARLDILLAIPDLNETTDESASNTKSLSARAVTLCADTLCMGIPYLCEPQHNKFGMVSAIGPLALASAWFKHLRRRGDEQVSEKVLWCFEASKRLKAAGIQPL